MILYSPTFNTLFDRGFMSFTNDKKNNALSILIKYDIFKIKNI